jgi:hypothetical protein
MSSQTRKNVKSVPFNALHGCPPGYQKRTSYKNGNLLQAARCVLVGTVGCAKGMIRRKGYTRRYSTGIRRRGYTVRRKTGTQYRVYPEKTHMVVKSACIKNRGLPGKGPREGKGIGKLDKGKLSKYGYSYHDPWYTRHESLKKAIKAYTALDVYHKLDAVAKYTTRTAPAASRVFAEDRNWVRSKFMRQ